MYAITHDNLNNRNFSFHLDGQGYYFSNASLYGEQKVYKWKFPWKGQEAERFLLIGDGNFNYVAEDKTNHSVAYLILQNRSSGQKYVLQSDVFSKYFILE